MDDLEQLNHQIAQHWLGRLDAEQAAYLDYTSVCLGDLTHSATEMARLLDGLKREDLNSLLIARLNRRYLSFARLAATEAAAGRTDMLLRLGISLDQAALLRSLTDEDIYRMAFGWGGPIVRFSVQAFRRGATLHAQAGRYHAAGLVAVRPNRQPRGSA
jgi:hypothetical protein